MRWLWMVAFVAGCEFITPPCPEGPLSSGDLPCLCQGSIVESLACGQLSCEATGLVVGATTGTCETTGDTGYYTGTSPF